jgi:hypothetical protein
VIELAVVFLSVGWILVSIKVTKLFKSLVGVYVTLANIMAILELQSKINDNLVNINDLDEEFKRMIKDM